MARRERRKFTDAYKAEVVALVRSSGKGIAAISRDLFPAWQALRESQQFAESGPLSPTVHSSKSMGDRRARSKDRPQSTTVLRWGRARSRREGAP